MRHHSLLSPIACLAALLISLLISTLAGCAGLLEVENASDPVILQGLGPAECPSDWTGDALPASLQEDLDEALTRAFTDVKLQIDSEARLRNIGDPTSIRFDFLVLHTSSATQVLTPQDTLGFVEEIFIYLEPIKSGSKLGRALVASHGSITQTATAVILETTNVNVMPYFKEGFRVTTEVVPRTCLAEDLTLRLSYRARVRYQDD